MSSSTSPARLQCGALLRFPRILDERGSLTFVEGARHLPFEIRRAYWIYGVPTGEERHGHAHRTLDEVLVALSGSFNVRLDDGAREWVATLNRPYVGLFVPRLTWRCVESFSSGAVCLALASAPFDAADYVRSRHEFRRLAADAAPDGES